MLGRTNTCYSQKTLVVFCPHRMALPIALRRNIHLSHAKQLAQLQLPLERDIHREDPPSGFLDTVKGWINDNAGAVRAAQEARQCFLPLWKCRRSFYLVLTECTSPAPDSPNWDTVFFSLMESSAMYLRHVSAIPLM